MSLIKLATPLEEIPGIQKRFLPKLKRLGIENVRDLLRHFPSRYEDWSEVSPIAELKIGDEKTVQGTVTSVRSNFIPGRRLLITEATIEDETGTIKAVWFNQPYVTQSLKEGRRVSIAGKVKKGKRGVHISSPVHEMLDTRNGEATRHTARIVPVYPETRGITSRGIRFILQPMLESVEQIPEFIPENILEELGLPEIDKALHDIHLPENIEDAEHARERFAFQDLFLLQLKNATEKLALQRQKAPTVKWTKTELRGLLKELPFKFTASQEEALAEILEDISEPHPMNRLLQGDVGSGKTIVAGIAAVIAANKANGLQAAFMAPTEILARQHYKTLTTLFDGFTGGIGLLLAKEARVFHGDELEEKTTKKKLADGVANGKIGIVIGTHTLIQKSLEFNKLGLVIVDEQHRFGVRQRAELTHGFKEAPHFLSMSATPIPRTLMMTVFGNLDISLITELPAGRREIITKIVDPKNRDKAYAFIRGEVRKGRQVYVICPRIESSNGEGEKKSVWDDVKAVEEEYEKLSKEVFPDLRVAMIHGKLKSAEKDEIMKTFAEGKSDVLVSTSVIEVGIDIPNATIIMIENAERFGLAQLYQFRGRVGRGEHQSFCFLFAKSQGETAKRRLESLLTAKNSFELAEKDLEIRGPGEFLGEAQSGLPDIAMKAIQNPKLLKSAEKNAAKLIKEDPELKGYPELRKRLGLFDKEVHLE